MFRKTVVAAEVARAGRKLRRVLMDGGSEFKADFNDVCKELNERHTRTKPRHAWTNGFVERPQGDHPPRALADCLSSTRLPPSLASVIAEFVS